jgi:hypothetical protein
MTGRAIDGRKDRALRSRPDEYWDMSATRRTDESKQRQSLAARAAAERPSPEQGRHEAMVGASIRSRLAEPRFTVRVPGIQPIITSGESELNYLGE